MSEQFALMGCGMCQHCGKKTTLINGVLRTSGARQSGNGFRANFNLVKLVFSFMFKYCTCFSFQPKVTLVGNLNDMSSRGFNCEWNKKCFDCNTTIYNEFTHTARTYTFTMYKVNVIRSAVWSAGSIQVPVVICCDCYNGVFCGRHDFKRWGLSRRGEQDAGIGLKKELDRISVWGWLNGSGRHCPPVSDSEDSS